ncbi:MAG TPA: OsmC family protein [Ktedonobacteraceae bacterium]
MAETMTVQSKLTTGMRFEVEAGSGHHVTLDAAEHGGGHNEGFRPMELLLAGLAGCTGMDVISILRKKRQEVTGYEVHVTGVRAEVHPMVFVEITVEHIVTGHRIQPEAVARAIKLSEERYCGAGAMLGKVAHLTHTYRIVEAAETLALATPLD